MKIVKGYYVYAAIDNYKSGRVKGPFSTYQIASLNCNKAGWYDSHGTVKEVEFFQDDKDNLYEKTKPVKFVDIENDLKEETLHKIREKLTQKEWEYIIENMI